MEEEEKLMERCWRGSAKRSHGVALEVVITPREEEEDVSGGIVSGV